MNAPYERFLAPPSGSPERATADAARALLDNWQRLHAGPPGYTAPSRVFEASRTAHAPEPSGALREMLMALLAALFVLERMLTHARRR